MTEEQFKKCLTCLNRREGVYDKNTICNLRGKDLNFVGECQDYDYDKNAISVTENQNVFEVYEKLKEPFFTLETVFNIYGVALLLILFTYIYFDLKLFDTYVIVLSVGLGLFIVISEIVNFNKIEKLYAKYLGQLVISKDQIQILNKKNDLSEIHKINFYNDDYVGMRKPPMTEFDMLPGLSNGVNNFMILQLNDGTSKKYRFMQKNKDDLLRNRDILIHYHLKGKLDFDDLKRILHVRRKRDVESLLNEIAEKKSKFE